MALLPLTYYALANLYDTKLKGQSHGKAVLQKIPAKQSA